MTSAGKKKPKKRNKGIRTKIIPVRAEDVSSDKEGDEEDGGMFLEKGDIQIIYNALREYKPTEEEEQRYELLLESFDEIFVIDCNEPYPDVN